MDRFNGPSAPNTRPEQKPEQLNQNMTPEGISWKKALGISALPLALLFGAAFQSSNSVPAQLQAILSEVSGLKSEISALQAQVITLANKGPRKYYLTQTAHDGAQALSACAEGYHMASMGEIRDTSNLRYNTDLGVTAPDSGFGPIVEYGWIRTGTIHFTSNLPGVANCAAWNLAVPEYFGTRVEPFLGWNNAGTTTSPWTSATHPCNSPSRVWCVQD